MLSRLKLFYKELGEQFDMTKAFLISKISIFSSKFLEEFNGYYHPENIR